MDNHLTIGFSLGTFRQSNLTVFEKMRKVSQLGCTAIELWLRHFKSEDYSVLTSEHFAPFSYVSLHAPKISFDANLEETQITIDQINKINKIRKLDLVVVHPDPIKDFAIFNNLGWPIGFENMDHQKPWGQTPEDIMKVLDTNENFNMVLDVNHIYANDKTMKLADEFYTKLGSRIKQFHVSGFATLHDPLFETQQTEIVKAIKKFDVPIIIESPTTPETMRLEYDFVLNALN